MRRSDYDITGKIRITDPIDVQAEVVRLFEALYPGQAWSVLTRAFDDMSKMYYGRHEEYHQCDTEYHDIQHVLDVSLAMARLLDGYARNEKNSLALRPAYFVLGVVIALFHDVGYLRRRHDHKHRFGAEYTLTHVSRGSTFLRR